MVSQDPIQKRVNDSIVKPNVWHELNVDVISQLEEKGFTWAPEGSELFVLLFQELEIKDYLFKNAQVIDCRLENVVLNFDGVAFLKTKHIEHVLKDDYLSPVQVHLRKAMSHADLVL